MATVALNNLGIAVYMSEVGVTPMASDKLAGTIKVTNPKSVKAEEIKYNSLEDGWAKHVPTIRDLEKMTMEIADEDESTVTRLDALLDIVNGSNMYKDLTFIIPKNAGFTKSSSFTVTVYMSASTLNDFDSNTYQGHKIEFQGSGKPKAFTGTIETALSE